MGRDAVTVAQLIADLAPLRAAGLGDQELLDLTHVAMFAWANRLLETLGEVVYQP
jgi:alkylhydroperoxidase family enzyme